MIHTFTGPMHSGKSLELINIYKKIYRKEYVLAFKPRQDKRDLDEIKSHETDYSIPAIYIDDLSEIKTHIKGKNIHTILIDEANMLTGDISELVDLSVICDIDFYIAGLNQNALQQPFGIMGDILAVSNSVTIFQGFCDECNKPAEYSYYIGTEPLDRIIADDKMYRVLCAKCLKRKLVRDIRTQRRVLKWFT